MQDTSHSATIDVQDEEVRVTGLRIGDPEVVDYLAGVDGDDRADALEYAVSVGVKTLKLAETSQEEEFVERKFSEMRTQLEAEIERIEDQVEARFGDDGDVPQIFDEHLGEDGKLEQHIQDAFGEDGAFVERLDEELGEDGERIQKALDPDTDGTPTQRLQQSIQEQISRLRDKIEEQATEEETREELKQRTTLKGEDFEETVGNILGDLVYGTSHELEYTGDEIGELSGRKVGDYVLTVDETGQQIVVEAKSDTGYSQRDIKEELAEAVENRDGDYGIIVFECASYVPNKVGYFHEFDSERLAVALSETDEDDLEPGFLRIAYNWAKTRAVQAYVDTGSAFDPEGVQTEVSEIEDDIGRFSTIRKKTTSIRTTADEIDEELKDIEADVTARLGNIRAELQGAPEQ